MDSCAVRNDRRDDRLLERTRRGHDIARLDGAFGCFHVKTRLAVVLPHGLDFDSGSDRCVDLLRVGREVVRDLILGGERVGADVEFLTGETVMPRRPVRHKGIPPARTPTLGDTVALHNQVWHTLQAEMFAHRDAGLAGADDENLDLLVRHHNLHQTLTGLSSLGASFVPRAMK